MSIIIMQPIYLETLETNPLVHYLHSVHLFKNDINPSNLDVVGLYDEATFSGYASINLTMGAAYLNAYAIGEVDSTLNSFTSTGASPVNTVYGAFILDAGGILVCAERFDIPRVVMASGQVIEYTLRMTQG